jgi:hypothetical protein
MIVLPTVVQTAPNAASRRPTANIILRDNGGALRSGFWRIRGTDVYTGHSPIKALRDRLSWRSDRE